MGYIRHDSIICSCFEMKHLAKAHKKATKLFDGMVSPIIEGKINKEYSFFIPPDGSKEGWEESNQMDELREEFKKWLREQNSFVQWVELSFGGDEPERNTKICDWGSYEERD